jgi:hypothetical protein
VRERERKREGERRIVTWLEEGFFVEEEHRVAGNKCE